VSAVSATPNPRLAVEVALAVVVTTQGGGGHVTWSGWGHVGPGFEVAYVPPWSLEGTFGPWIQARDKFPQKVSRNENKAKTKTKC
jgi:hypothetical protein